MGVVRPRDDLVCVESPLGAKANSSAARMSAMSPLWTLPNLA